MVLFFLIVVPTAIVTLRLLSEGHGWSALFLLGGGTLAGLMIAVWFRQRKNGCFFPRCAGSSTG
jgi:hypothetical protein